MKYVIIMVLIVNTLFGAKITQVTWQKGRTFSQYLESYNISPDLLDAVSKEDQKFLSEIRSQYNCYELKNDSGSLLQALIPITNWA